MLFVLHKLDGSEVVGNLLSMLILLIGISGNTGSWLFIAPDFRLAVAFLPILVHLHQSQLDFLTGFFGGISSSADSDPHGISGSELSISELHTVGGQIISKEALLPFFQASLLFDFFAWEPKILT